MSFLDWHGSHNYILSWIEVVSLNLQNFIQGCAFEGKGKGKEKGKGARKRKRKRSTSSVVLYKILIMLRYDKPYPCTHFTFPSLKRNACVILFRFPGTSRFHICRWMKRKPPHAICGSIPPTSPLATGWQLAPFRTPHVDFTRSRNYSPHPRAGLGPQARGPPPRTWARSPPREQVVGGAHRRRAATPRHTDGAPVPSSRGPHARATPRPSACTPSGAERLVCFQPSRGPRARGAGTSAVRQRGHRDHRAGAPTHEGVATCVTRPPRLAPSGSCSFVRVRPRPWYPAARRPRLI